MCDYQNLVLVAEYHHSITESTVRRLTIGQRIEKRDASTAQLSPAHFARAILKVSYTTALMLNISRTVTDTTMVSMEVEYETTPGLSIGTMIFDLGWLWTVLVQGHQHCTPNISEMATDTVVGSI